MIIKRMCMTAFTSIVAVFFSTAYAATYTWTDEQGTVHFTEDLGTVPVKIRDKAKKLEETELEAEAKPAQLVPSINAADAILQAVPSAGDSEGIYAGKTYGQWKTDLAEREAAMTAIRKRIDEIAVLFKNPLAGKTERDKLLAEHASLSAQFKEMKIQYLQQVEIARKAGLQVTIEQ